MPRTISVSPGQGPKYRGSSRGRKHGRASKKQREAIFRRDDYECQRCGSEYNLRVDHIKPIAKGGTNTQDNMQTLCEPCNSAKGDKTICYLDPNLDEVTA